MRVMATRWVVEKKPFKLGGFVTYEIEEKNYNFCLNQHVSARLPKKKKKS